MRAWWYEVFLYACCLLTIAGGYHVLGSLMMGCVLYRRAPRMMWQGVQNIIFLCRVMVYRVRRWRK